MSETSQSPDVDDRRLALEIVSTLVNHKKIAAERVLAPSGVPAELTHRFLTEKDPTTGAKRTKREAAVVIFDALATSGDETAVIRRMIDLAAGWSDFHLAQDEFRARSVAQKARERLGVLHDLERRERSEAAQRQAEAEAARELEIDRLRRERASLVRSQSELLLAQFDQAVVQGDPQQRGYFLEDLLMRVFDLHGIPATPAFRRNKGGEQIDGAFEFEGWHYISECRWREQLADMNQLDGLIGKVSRSGRQTMGLFLSINGWSGHVVELLKQSPGKNIILMNATDLRAVLAGHIGLTALLKAKLSALNFHAEPYRSASEALG